jgi:uncharacterized protein YidB (DUF937 family)
MGLLDQVLGDVLAQSGGNAGRARPGAASGAGAAQMAGGGALLAMAMQFVSNYPGGLPALLSQLTGGGQSRQVDSWVGAGQNEPISPDVLSQIFGQGRIEDAGRQFGVEDPRLAAGGLAALLPELVNQLTPQGKLEPQVENASGDELASLLDGLRRNFG